MKSPSQLGYIIQGNLDHVLTEQLHEEGKARHTHKFITVGAAFLLRELYRLLLCCGGCSHSVINKSTNNGAVIKHLTGQ